MARIRTIKPEFPEDEKLGAVSRDARLMFILLWATCCDDHGTFRANPTYLRTSLFPYDDISIKHVAAWLDELAEAGRVVLYVVAGERFGYVVNWERHQRIDNAGKPVYPGPDQGECDDLAASRGESRRTSAGDGDSPLDLDLDLDLDRAPSTPAASDGFTEFWAAYPRKVDRKKAHGIWKRLTNADRVAARSAISSHVAAWRNEHPDTDKFIPHPTTWLNGRRWEDDVKIVRPAGHVNSHGVRIAGANAV